MDLYDMMYVRWCFRESWRKGRVRSVCTGYLCRLVSSQSCKSSNSQLSSQTHSQPLPLLRSLTPRSSKSLHHPWTHLSHLALHHSSRSHSHRPLRHTEAIHHPTSLTHHAHSQRLCSFVAPSAVLGRIDFHVNRRTRNGFRVPPLTLTDAYSRGVAGHGCSRAWSCFGRRCCDGYYAFPARDASGSYGGTRGAMVACRCAGRATLATRTRDRRRRCGFVHAVRAEGSRGRNLSLRSGVGGCDDGVFARVRTGGRLSADFLGGASCCATGCADGDTGSRASVAFLDHVCFQTERTDDTVEFEEETAGVAERVAFWVASPEGCGLSEAIRAGRGKPVRILASTGLTRQIRRASMFAPTRTRRSARSHR